MLYKQNIDKMRKSHLVSLGAIASLALSSSLYADQNSTTNGNDTNGLSYQPQIETNIIPTTKFKTVEIKDKIEEDDALPRYQPTIATVGKTKQSVHETPQAITVVTKELLADQAKFTLKEAMTNVAGLTFNAAEGGRIGDNMNLRGFYTFGDLYLDGIRDVSQYNRDAFNLESVDVLRGGAAMLYGRGQAGGVISQQSKVAKAEDFGKLSHTVGENDFARYSLDVNQMINDTTAVRLNLMNQSGGSTRNDVLNESTGIAPSIAFGLGTNNEFSISHLYLKTNLTPDYGVPFYNKAPLDVDPSTYYGFKEDYEANKVNMTTLNNLHKFADGSELKTTLRKAKYLRDNWAIAPSSYDATTGKVNRSLKGNGAEEEVKTLQNDFTTNFEALGVQHSILAGNEILLEEQTRWGHTGISSKFPNLTKTTGATDTYGLPANPTNGQRVLARNGIYYQYSSSGAGSWSAQLPNTLESSSSLPDAYKSYYGNKDRVISGGYKGKTIAFYVQDTIEFTPELKLMAGMRHDRLRMDYLDANLTKNGDLQYDENSYRAGLSYEPHSNAHYYLSWNNSFNTTGDLYSFSNAFDPEKSITYELGSKWQLFEGDLALRTSLYRTIKEWERNTDVASASSNPILTRERHTDGFEIEAAGRVTQDLEIFAAYTKMKAEVDEVAPGKGTIYEGKRPPNATDYTYNAWLTYKLNKNWKVGGGLEGKGDRYVYSYGGTTTTTFAPNTAPSYVKGDVMVTYTKKDYDIQLNVKNVTDKTYYDAAYINGGFIVPGNGRTATVTLNYKF